ncbi:MAG: MFS transporter [Acutalibacteraceae bacterium]|nr:MFS transporter [Acutalibacteraceae bacterium]
MSSENSTAVKEQIVEQNTKRYVRPREIAAYALTSYGLNNLTSFIGSTKQYFMMSFMGLTGGQYALLGTVSTIWDALDDPISGIVIDRFRTRWGRLRPFLILSMPLWAISSILFYVVPGSFNSNQMLIYALAATIIYGIGFSYLSGWELLLYNMTPNTSERGTLIATQKFVNLFTWIPSLVPVFVDFVPGVTKNAITQPEVYRGFSILFVVAAAASAVYGFFVMKERVSIASKDEIKQVGFFRSAKSILTCRPLWALLLSGFFGGIKGVGGASEDFFWLNCTGKLSNRLLCSLFTGIPNYVITPVAPSVINKFGLRTTAISAGVFSGLAYTALYFIGYKPTGNYWIDFVIVTVGLTVCGLPNHIMGVCDPLLKGDMYDYLEWKTGIRNEGIVNAVMSYVNKLSSSVHTFLSGVVFDWIKFTPQKDIFGNVVPHTNPKVLKGIWGIFCLAPAVARYGYGLALFFFNVHGKNKEKMLIELAEHRNARAVVKRQELSEIENTEN